MGTPRNRPLRVLSIALLPALLSLACAGSHRAKAPQSWETAIFAEEMIHFLPADPTQFASQGIVTFDNGRSIRRTVNLPDREGNFRIFARIATIPIPDGPLSVHDIWDRAGYVALIRPGEPPIEVVKFITAYGGFTEHEINVTQLAPLLSGECEFEGFVDTWASPGWKMNFSLRFEPAKINPPDWATSLINIQSLRETTPAAELGMAVDIPDDLDRLELHYLVSGHCTDGTDADEFVTKPNVIAVDGEEALRFEPWRDDCLQYRAINPYCKRWSDGSWSSDYSRSGWCPSDAVAPLVYDVTGLLGSGRHTFDFSIEGVRPENEDGHHGYWRVSAYLVGWRD